MARLYQAGAEIDGGVNTQNASPDGSLGGAVTRDTVTFRSGLASWKCDAGAGNAQAAVGTTSAPNIITFVDGNSYWFRGYFNAASAPTAASSILWTGGVNDTDIQARLRTDGGVELLANNVVQGSPSASIADGTWHRVELKAVATATTTWTAAELQVDGVSVATWSGSFTRHNNFNWGWEVAPGANKVINVDDVACNDSTGAANTSWPGSGKVVLLSPISDNAVGTGWTTSGGSGSNLFACVDNIPETGIADTTGNEGHQIRNATSNASVSYDANMTTYTTAGVGASDTVNAVSTYAATGAPVTTSAKQGLVGAASNPAITTVALSATGTSGAFWAGATAGTFGAGWKWSPGTISNAPSVTLGTSPVMRITQVTSSTRIAMCCAMFMYVDYTPAAAAAATTRATVTMAPYTPSRGGF